MVFRNKKSKIKTGILVGSFAGILLSYMFVYGLKYSSTNEFCESCHVHPQATQSWRMSTHFDNKSGIAVKCVDCHLPPDGFDYVFAKATTGARDIYGKLFKDESEFNWEQKSQREFAVNHVYKESCINCHTNLFPRQLSTKGGDAHVYYDQYKDRLRCINCHLEVGHYHEPKPEDEIPLLDKVIYSAPAIIDSFSNYTETIPGSYFDFKMIAVPAGEFTIGSPDTEPYRKNDEGPQRKIILNQFWVGETEITWDVYSLFLKETGGEGRTEDQYASIAAGKKVDGISGPTPPYGNPGQGWGKGKRPAITMTHHAATVFCEWLSGKTAKKYRLPTEAEWEYACRGNTKGAYYFEGDPSDFSEKGFWNSIFGADTSIINSFANYSLNSGNKSAVVDKYRPNPLGIKNMLGNVKEFCSDFYSERTYADYTDGVQNPEGPSEGKERVIRGGSFKSDASDLRIAARDKTNYKAWMLTDPQVPKSLWWYSDNNEVGFRVVCEYLNTITNNR